jgi:hypothetical protein
MAVDERRRLELADAVKGTLGVEAGLTLMEMLPPVGWADVATKHDLDALSAITKRDLEAQSSITKRELAALEQRIDLRFEACEHRLTAAFHAEMVAQTWRYVAAMGALFTAFTAVVTVVIRL